MARSPRKPAAAGGGGLHPRAAALLQLPVEEFTRARDALARELAAAGDAAAAAQVRKLRRPTIAAWTLNRLARERPADVAALLAAGEELERLQADVLAGRAGGAAREALRAASDAQARALSELLRAAGPMATAAGHPPAAALLGKVERGLRAAAAEAAAREALRAGALEREPQPAEADLLAGLATVPPPQASPGRKQARAPEWGRGRDRVPEQREREERDRGPEREQDREREQRDRERERERERREREQERERERERLAARRRADEEVARALRDVEDAEKALAEARRRLAAARVARQRL
jgi:hypothetical protein